MNLTWIWLVITIGPANHEFAMVPFPDAMSCGNALPAIHGSIAQVYPDSMASCVDSGVPKTRPRIRPANLIGAKL